MQGKTDEALMLMYQNGDHSAFEVLYQRYEKRVFGYLAKRLDKKNWVEDVFQSVFIKLHQSRYRYDSSYLFSQWVFVITKTVLLDFWKTTDLKTNRFFSKSLEDLTESQIPLTENPLAEDSLSNIIVAEGYPLSEHAMTGVSSVQRRAIEYRFFDDLSYADIAKKLSRSEESVRQLVSRAIRKMRNNLKLGGQS